MGVYGKVSEAGTTRVNPEHMNRLGSFYARIEQSKYVVSPDKGNFAVVECTVIENHDDAYKKGELLQHMRSQDKYGFMTRYMQEYVAAYNNVKVGYKFDENEAKNDEIWDGHMQEVFGAPTMENGQMVYKNSNVLKGLVFHYMIVEDDQSGRKEKKKDAKGDVIIYKEVKLMGLVDPADIDPAILAEEQPNLHAAYHGE